ncbi:MAG: PqqD family protein [Marinilabiliales bacterium]|nr:MAG: PqqD family protein [Marinilabiliales bacterium]
MITADTKIQRKQDIVFNRMDNEVVMLNLEKGEYYGLDEIGSRIWDIIEDEISFQNLIQKLMEEFEVEESMCAADTKDFLMDLHEKKLLVIQA